jgi:hypothetical protein
MVRESTSFYKYRILTSSAIGYVGVPLIRNLNKVKRIKDILDKVKQNK